MIAITHNELHEDLTVCYKSNKPAFIRGKIGIGKSFMVKQTADEYAKSIGKEFIEYSKLSNSERDTMATNITFSIKDKFIFFDIRSAMLDPSDIKGLPSLSGSFVKWLPDIVFRICSRPDFNGLIFFDEINQALPSVQSALYQVILDNSAGTVRLSDNCLRIAAGNRMKDQSNVNQMSKALEQRFVNMELEAPNAKDWVRNFAIDNNIHKSVISYILFKPDNLNIEIDRAKDQASFANPRNWERYSDQLYVIDKIHNNVKSDKYFDQLSRLADSNIGGDAAVNFIAYMKLHSVINIQDLIDNPSKIQNLSLDKKWYAMDMLADEYGKHGKKIIGSLIEIFKNVDIEISATAFTQMTKMNKLFSSQLIGNKDGIEWLNKVSEIYKR